MADPGIFSADEAQFLAEYRALCLRYEMCPVVEAPGRMGLINFSKNRIWGCTAAQMVDKQIEEIAELVQEVPEE